MDGQIRVASSCAGLLRRRAGARLLHLLLVMAVRGVLTARLLRGRLHLTGDCTRTYLVIIQPRLILHMTVVLVL